MKRVSISKEEIREVMARFRPIDNTYMKIFFEDRECVQCVLRVIMDKPDLTVLSVHTEYDLKQVYSHSVRIDIAAKDSTGKIYAIEIQRDNRGAGEKRARRNAAMLDTNCEDPGQYGENLPESYVIFITENDVIGDGLPIYHIDRYVRETGKRFDDDMHIIYVNNKVQDETALGRLMHDFACSTSEDMHYPELRERQRYLKETEKGELEMEDFLKDAFEKTLKPYSEIYRNQGKAEGIGIGKAESLQNLMKSMKWDPARAMDALCIPQEERPTYLAMIAQ